MDIGSSPILFQPVAQTRILQKLVDRARDEMRRGLVSRQQEQEDHRHDLMATELLALAVADAAEERARAIEPRRHRGRHVLVIVDRVRIEKFVVTS